MQQWPSADPFLYATGAFRGSSFVSWSHLVFAISCLLDTPSSIRPPFLVEDEDVRHGQGSITAIIVLEGPLFGKDLGWIMFNSRISRAPFPLWYMSFTVYPFSAF